MSLAPAEFAARLLVWFDAHGRHDLPWQVNRTPYRVWISEVMLQQTQVATVIPYYARFMARFPDMQSLAAAPLDEVLHLWTGLGYYARARNLHACAKQVISDFGGVFPTELERVMSLPGIGRSTAGAILAISQEQRHPILDGNVKRVLSRVFGVVGDPSTKAVIDKSWLIAAACTPHSRVADYTQAIMDLGATLCTRSRPACTVCPMATGCIAAVEGRQAELPSAKKKRIRPTREATLLIAQRGTDELTSILLEQRPSHGIWGGLWSPPQFESQNSAIEWCVQELGTVDVTPETLPSIDHAFTHFDLKLHPLRIRCESQPIVERDDRQWYSLSSPARVGLPQPIRQLLERLRQHSGDR